MEGNDSKLVRYSTLLRRAAERGDVKLALELLAERERFFAGGSFGLDEIKEAVAIDGETLELLEKRKEDLRSEILKVQRALEILRGVHSSPKKRFEVVI